MKSIKFLATLSAFAFSSAMAATTDPVGFVSVPVPTASDVALGAPLGRASEFQGVIQSIAGNTITMAGTPNFAANAFVYSAGVQAKTYFLRIDSDTKEGLILPITANGTASVDITIPAGEDLTGVLTNAANGTGSSVSIAPYWTVGTLFTGAIAGTQILITSTATAGINLPTTTYTFNGTNWLKGPTASNDDILQVSQGVTVRNNSTTTALTLSVTGSVPMTAHRMRLATLAGSTRQDIRIFYNSPIPEVIGNVFNVGSLAPGDQLLYVDNATSGKNKPTVTLVWNGTNWLQGATTVTTTFNLLPGQSYLFRKNQSVSPSSVVWTDLQSYLQ
jgi:uncharacterized protein (TIGR02597 family)